MATVVGEKQNKAESYDVKTIPFNTGSSIGPQPNQKKTMEENLNEISTMASDSAAYLHTINYANKDHLKGDCVKYAPGVPLPSGGVTMEEVQRHLESLILQAEDEDRNSSAIEVRPLELAGKVALVSQSLAAHVSTLEPRCVRRLAMRIISDTSLWISRIFRFFDTSSYFHDESREGLVKLCRMLLYAKYPKYQTDGFEALYSKPPVIYISAATRQGLGHYLCSQLGLPLSSLTTIPCSQLPGTVYKMELGMLEEAIQQDLKSARTPLIVVAGAGSGTVGPVDNLARLGELCRAHDLWLHLEGHCLAGLCLLPPGAPARLPAGDSVTLPLGTWLGVPSLPAATLYRPLEQSLVQAAGLSSFSLYVRLGCLPLWATLQALGQEAICQRVRQAFDISEYLLEKLEQTPKIKIISKERLKNKEGKIHSLADVLSKSVNITLLFDILVPVIVFQYVGDDLVANARDDAKIEDKYSIRNPTYFDNLNSWICQVLRKDWPHIRLDLLELDHYNICLRICPIEGANLSSVTKKDVNNFYAYLLQQLEILTATVHKKQLFYDLVRSHPNLQLVHISNWAGLGGVRYIPEACVNNLNELTDVDKEEINKINSELVMRLKSTDSAFSIGEGDDLMQCVRFGMVTEELDVEELVGLVASVGLEMEESSRCLETMTEMVKQGIQEANRELEQENVDKLMQEGLLRHVPVVGNFYNWWSPQAKESGIKGRSFNLTSGTVESTENIYKYHMQIQQGGGPAVKPPAAQVIIKCEGKASASQQAAITTTITNAKTQGAHV